VRRAPVLARVVERRTGPQRGRNAGGAKSARVGAARERCGIFPGLGLAKGETDDALCRGSPRRRKASVAGAAPSGRGMRRGTSAGPTVRAAEPIGAVPPSGRGGVRRLTRLGLIGIACAAGLAPPPAAEAAGAPPESLTVAQCVGLARAAAPEVRALAAGRQAAGLDSAAAALNRRPAYTLTGGATAAPPFSYDPVITNLGEYRLLVGMQVPLRDAGERRRERAQAGLGAASASAELERAAREAGER